MQPHPGTSQSDLFVILSVINTGNHRWSYTPTRSVYTPQERFEQTLQTINSIRDHAPAGTRILLVECSELTAVMNETLSSRVDIYAQLFDKEEIRDICLRTEKKGYGEAILTSEAIRIIKDAALDFRRIFKISGRYWLKPGFNAETFSDSMFTFKPAGSGSHSTVLYSVPKCLFGEYDRVIALCCNRYRTEATIFCWEGLFPQACHPRTVIPLLNVAGTVGISKELFYHG